MEEAVDDAAKETSPKPYYSSGDESDGKVRLQPKTYDSTSTRCTEREPARVSSIGRADGSSSSRTARLCVLDEDFCNVLEPEPRSRMAAVSTTDLPPLEDYLERRQLLQRQQQLMIASVAEATSREANASVEACMAKLEPKLIAGMRQALAQEVADHLEKLTPKLVKMMGKEEKTLADNMAALTSLLQTVLAQGHGNFSSPGHGGSSAAAGAHTATSLSFAGRAKGSHEALSCSKQKSFNLSDSNSGSDRSVRALEQELADQVLEGSGFRNASRSSTKKSSFTSVLSRRRPSDAGMAPSRSEGSVIAFRSETAGISPLVRIVPSDIAGACATSATTPTVVEEAPATGEVPTLLGSMLTVNEAGERLEQTQSSSVAPFERIYSPPTASSLPSYDEDQVSVEEFDDDKLPALPTQPSPMEPNLSQVANVAAAGDDIAPPKGSPIALRSRERMTTSQIRRVRVNELIEGVTSTLSKVSSNDEDSEDDLSEVGWDASSPATFRICGIIPWSTVRPAVSSSYQLAVWFVTLAASSYLITCMILERIHGPALPGVEPHQERSRPCNPLSLLPMVLGSVVGLAVLGRCGCSCVLREDFALLRAYALKHEFLARWERRYLIDRWSMLVAWLLANAAQAGNVLSDGLQHVSSTDLAHLLAFAIVSGILLGLVLCMIYVCRALTMMVDTFCAHVVDFPDLAVIEEEWNVLQAVLRKVSGAIEYGFVALQAVMVFTMPLLLADFYLLGATHSTAASSLPSVFILIGVLRMFALASMITDKCTRVPSLINSLPLQQGTAYDKQHIVDYIVNSAAGFYVCDVRLNMGLALKFIYGWGVVAFGLITHLFSTS